MLSFILIGVLLISGWLITYYGSKNILESSDNVFHAILYTVVIGVIMCVGWIVILLLGREGNF